MTKETMEMVKQATRHVPLVEQTRDGLVESIHYGSLVALNADGSTALEAGEPDAPMYPRSSLKPLQAVALLKAGLDIPERLLALTAASHSGGKDHRDGAAEILKIHGLTEAALANSTDLPYGFNERNQWLREGNGPTRLAQNCSGKHASMASVCVINGWPVEGYLHPEHPLQVLVRDTITELTGEDAAAVSTDGCGTPLFAHSLHAMARAYGRLASADEQTNEGKVAHAMRRHPDMVAGEGRDVTALMRAVPGLLAKDGFEGLQLVGLADGRAVAVKISDGGDRARMPITLEVLRRLGLDGGNLDTLQSPPVLGGGLPVGELRAGHIFTTN
ncbi:MULTISPECIES: asparaginase [Paenarthrobacter]|uniref:Asparaginase n=2 Tax=Paenarthrobacter TaxID=1742992 RepID=A0AAX3EI50_PAEUR|nr:MULTISPECIES: asparaginase [Paenarthrobacter]NKR11380.1 asparaginase [Arthrobacter sp. M5]NKR14354.1 asparaginase [Arthrobacter sp. M6]OEH58447.1 asparaginase [Arthrobacter sp. D4]OEH61757.1 asparaginase [Arthrobacter sp. D2]MDO5877557.1 asparaginase [Paenarthrobacter sp. SD-1]